MKPAQFEPTTEFAHFKTVMRGFWVLSFFSVASCVQATSIAILSTPVSIVIAADSLGHVSGEPVSMCKIQPIGSMFYAVAGINEDKQSGFNVATLVMSAAGAGTVIETANQFQKISTIPFTRALNRIRQDAPRYYKKQVMRGPEPLQVAIMAFEHGAPVVSVVYFTVSTISNGVIRTVPHRKDCPGEACSDVRGIQLLGENVASVNISKAPSFWSSTNDPISVVRKLVDIEIADQPQNVGPPIAILTISAAGHNWNQQGYCAQ